MDTDQIALIALCLLAIGYGLVLLIWLIPARRNLAKELFNTLNPAALVLGALVGIFLLGGWALGIALAALSCRIGYEAGHVRLGPQQAPLVAAATLALSIGAMTLPLAALTYAGIWCLAAVRLVAFPRNSSRTIRGWGELLVFPLLPLGILAAAALNPALGPVMLACYILVETFDSYSLLTGKLIGRTKAFPQLSPRKTVEGLAGGVAGLALTAVLVALIVGKPLWGAVVLALTVGLFSLAGDLGASRMKRKAGVKDFPVVLKSQGGLFDTFDSWIAAGAGVAALSMILIAQ
nr:phosphatidate cytidylyltransferase [Shimia biformata]